MGFRSNEHRTQDVILIVRFIAHLVLAAKLSAEPIPGPSPEPAAASAYSENARNLYERGRQAEKTGRLIEAYTAYSQAAKLAPNVRKYRARVKRLEGRAEEAIRHQKDEETAARAEADRLIAEPIPETINVDGRITDPEVREARLYRPPARLEGPSKRISHDLKMEPRPLFERVANLYGFEVFFDAEYQPNSAPFSFRLDNASWIQALRALETVTGTFIVPMDSRRFMVAKDTQQKRQELEPNVVLVIPLPEPVTTQEAQEVARSVQQIMEIQKFIVDGTRRMVLIRDRVSKAYPAQYLFDQLLYHRPMVSVELELISFSKNQSQSYGLDLPTRSTLVDFGRGGAETAAAIGRFLVFGGGQSFIGLGLTSAQMFAQMSQSVGKNLLRTEIRSVDGQPAQIHIGDRFPILTSGYFGTTSVPTTGPAAGNTTLFRPPPSFQFEDLGLSLKVTPHAHGMDEMTLEVESEFKILSGGSSNDIPIISNRKFTSKIRLRNGEWGIVAGLFSATDSRNISGIPGLRDIPGIGRAFRSNLKSLDETETLLVLKPHLLSMPSTEIATKAMWIGTESRVLTPLSTPGQVIAIDPEPDAKLARFDFPSVPLPSVVENWHEPERAARVIRFEFPALGNGLTPPRFEHSATETGGVD